MSAPNPVPTPGQCTREEIDALKRNWLADPCWDIEDTEGFEEHREELLAYRKETEHRQERERVERLGKLADRLGFPLRDYSQDTRIRLAAYVEGLEWTIERLMERVERLEGGA